MITMEEMVNSKENMENIKKSMYLDNKNRPRYKPGVKIANPSGSCYEVQVDGSYKKVADWK